MNVYFRGAVCKIESGAPMMVYLVIQKPGMRTRTIRITMGQPGMLDFATPNELYDDLRVQSAVPGSYVARNCEQMGITLGDLEMMAYQALKEENMR